MSRSPWPHVNKPNRVPQSRVLFIVFWSYHFFLFCFDSYCPFLFHMTLSILSLCVSPLFFSLPFFFFSFFYLLLQGWGKGTGLAVFLIGLANQPQFLLPTSFSFLSWSKGYGLAVILIGLANQLHLTLPSLFGLGQGVRSGRYPDWSGQSALLPCSVFFQIWSKGCGLAVVPIGLANQLHFYLLFRPSAIHTLVFRSLSVFPPFSPTCEARDYQPSPQIWWRLAGTAVLLCSGASCHHLAFAKRFFPEFIYAPSLIFPYLFIHHVLITFLFFALLSFCFFFFLRNYFQ